MAKKQEQQTATAEEQKGHEVQQQQEAQLPTAPAQTAVAVASVSDMMEQDAGGGFEAADKDAYAIPFLTILQSGSPQVKRSDGAYIKGAEEGMLYNSVTQEVHSGEADAGVLVVPAYFIRKFTRWGARDAGGGLKGEYSPSDPILQKCRGEGGADVGFGARLLPDSKGEFNLKTSDILNDTRTHYVLALRDKDGKFATKLEDAVSFSPMLVSVTSTQIRKSRLWMSKMQDLKLRRKDGTLFTPPMFSHAYRLTTVPENNDQGSWYGWKIELVGQLTDPAIYSAARDFRDAVKRGEVKAAPMTEESLSGAGESRRGAGTPAGGEGDDKDIPF